MATTAEYGLGEFTFPRGWFMVAEATELENGPIAVRAAKKSVHHGLQMAVADAYQFEIATYDKLIGTSDRHEGVLAFNEKRKPKFTGK